MGYRLRMPAEIGEWLADLAGTEPEPAIEIGAALTALINSSKEPGPPLVTGTVPTTPGPDADPREVLDYQYQQLLEALQYVRSEVTDVASQQVRLQVQLEVAGLDPAMRAAMERQLAAADELEPLLSKRARRLQSLVDTIRTQKETAKAVITAAEARARVQDALAELDPELTGQQGPGSRLGLSDEPGPDSEPAGSEWTARLDGLVAEAHQLLAAEHDEPDVQATAERPSESIRELHADPLGSSARLLFAAEPSDTIVLLAVLENAEAVEQHESAAIGAAADLLDQIRDGGWPPAGDDAGLEFADADQFLTRFFPEARADVVARAAALAELTDLAALREAQHLSIAELARRAGLRPGAAASAEADLLSAELADVAAYVRALGGTLRLTVGLEGEQHRIS
jgi:phage shock protein A